MRRAPFFPAKSVPDRQLLVWPDSPLPGAVLATMTGAAVVVGVSPDVGGPPAGAFAVGLFLAASTIMLAGLQRAYPHSEFGAANTVTLLRLSLVAVLAAAAAEGPSLTSNWALPAVATLALLLDGVDGWLARRTGLVSRFGARFDMEVDCVFALTLSLLVLESGKVGTWVLSLGLARYVFWVASMALPWLNGPLPDRPSRKTVCVGQILVLIALVSPLMQPPQAAIAAAATLGAVVWSFAVDVRHLRRARR